MMGHHILGFIARWEDLRRAASNLREAHVVPLALGFGFLPVTQQLAGDDEPAPFEHLDRLTARLGQWAAEQSRLFPLAYVETDYFGGVGLQAAIAWKNGRPAFGPVRTTDLWERGRSIPTPLLDGAINQAVRHIGVARGEAQDEFDALGLGQHRSNESWLS